MKKVLAYMLALIMVFSLVACGPKTNAPDETKAPEEKTEAPENPADDGEKEDEESTEPESEDETEGEEEEEEPTDDDEDLSYVGHESGVLVITSAQFNEIFSQFFAQTVDDRNIADYTSAGLLGYDPKGMPDDTGLAPYQEPEEVAEDDIVYTFKLKDDLVFSDGEPLTVDDIIFTMKVYLDPTYTGNTTLYTVPIKGALEYRYDDVDFEANLKAIDDEVKAYEPSDEEVNAKAEELFEMYKDDVPDLTLDDFLPEGIYYEDETVAELVKAFEAEKMDSYIQGNLEDGIDVPEIEGLEKVSDTELKVHLTRKDPTAIYKLGISVQPEHYYGEGFAKGNLDGVKAKDKEPLGAGPFIFKGFKDNVVSFEANPYYHKGEPKIKKMKVQVVSQTALLEAAVRGDVDISEPKASPDMVEKAEGYENIHTELIDNNGYGYIGINADNIKDKLIRQGLFHLLDRQTAVESYYGSLASIIERPMSRANWAYPETATEYYGFNPEKALEKFQEAGYELQDGKLMKDGKQLSVLVAYPGGDDDDHPVKPVFSTLKEEGEKLGLAIDLQNMQWNDFSSAVHGGTVDMWAMAWQATIDPDMTQIYKSTSPGNIYHVKNDELDELIEAGLRTLNLEERKEIYAQALDIVMEEAVEMPFYQRKNMVVFNTEVVDIDTLPELFTPFYGWASEIETLEIVK